MISAAGFLGLEFLPAHQAIAWLSWITNLARAEYAIRRKRMTTTHPMIATAMAR